MNWSNEKIKNWATNRSVVQAKLKVTDFEIRRFCYYFFYILSQLFCSSGKRRERDFHKQQPIFDNSLENLHLLYTKGATKKKRETLFQQQFTAVHCNSFCFIRFPFPTNCFNKLRWLSFIFFLLSSMYCEKVY